MAQIDAQPGPDLTEMRREVVGRLAVLKRRLGVWLALEGLARTAATVIVSRRVVAGKERQFEAWMTRLLSRETWKAW